MQKKSRIGIVGGTIASANIFKISYAKKNFLNAYFLFRLRDGSKPLGVKLTKRAEYIRMSLRIHFNYIALTGVELRSRIELNTYKFQGNPENGILCYQELVYKVPQQKFRTRFRFTFFETTDYESRIYAYEQTVPAYYSIPSYSGVGFKTQIILGLKLFENIQFDFSFTRISYYDRSEIGSGFDIIYDSKKTEIKSQLMCKF